MPRFYRRTWRKHMMTSSFVCELSAAQPEMLARTPRADQPCLRHPMRSADLHVRGITAVPRVRPRAIRAVCEIPTMQGVAAVGGGRGVRGCALPSSSTSSDGAPVRTSPVRSGGSCMNGGPACPVHADHHQQRAACRGRRCRNEGHASPHPSRSADHTDGTADPVASPSAVAPRPDPCMSRSAAAPDQKPSVTPSPYSRSAVYMSSCSSVKR